VTELKKSIHVQNNNDTQSITIIVEKMSFQGLSEDADADGCVMKLGEEHSRTTGSMRKTPVDQTSMYACGGQTLICVDRQNSSLCDRRRRRAVCRTERGEEVPNRAGICRLSSKVEQSQGRLQAEIWAAVRKNPDFLYLRI